MADAAWEFVVFHSGQWIWVWVRSGFAGQAERTRETAGIGDEGAGGRWLKGGTGMPE